MLWIALAAAAQISAPVPTNLREWFSARDVPDYLGRTGGGTWKVGVRLVVGSDAALRVCYVQNSSGIADLDKLTCSLIEKRARFQPARWSDGSAVVGVFSTAVTWSVMTPFEGPPQFNLPKGSEADLDVSINQLPAGAKSPSLVRVMFAVDSTGKMLSCAAETTENFIRAENDPVLIPVACDQLLASYKPLRINDAAGRPIRTVQDALVRFSTKR
jgi:hypothetical protein